VLESTGACFGEPAEHARQRARDLQDVLGELHDCDVMLPRVGAHATKLREEDARAVRASAGDADDLDAGLVSQAPNRTAYRGLEMLAVHLQARRALLFDRFVELWGELERERIWKRLEHAVEQRSG
jgi:CHAD domain-containing protein